jgi:Carbohydrate family 9 binding domain-like
MSRTSCLSYLAVTCLSVLALAACRPDRNKGVSGGGGSPGGGQTESSDSSDSGGATGGGSSESGGRTASSSSEASGGSGGSASSSSEASGGSGGGTATTGGGTGGTAATGGTGGGNTTTGTAGTTGTSGCTSSAGTATPCTGIPAFAGTQVLDGDDSDFCNVPSFELNFQNAAKVKEYNPNGKSSPERAIARVAWDASGIHAFIRVIDPKFVPAANLDNIWNADGIELMFSSTTTGLKGGTADDSAITTHVIASPPFVARSKATGTNGAQAALETKYYVAGTTSDGYKVEFNLPWPGTPPTTGAQIKFDMEMNAADGTSTNGDAGPRDAQGMLYVGSDPGGSPCNGELFPYCDDRLWCSTSLQ